MTDTEIREPVKVFDPTLIEHLTDAIEDAIYTKFGPCDPPELEAAMRQVTDELIKRWKK